MRLTACAHTFQPAWTTAAESTRKMAVVDMRTLRPIARHDGRVLQALSVQMTAADRRRPWRRRDQPQSIPAARGYLAADRRSVTVAPATVGSSASFGLVEMRRL